MTASIWLAVILIGLALWTINDMRQHRLFKAVDSSAGRQRFYILWTIQSFILLVGASAMTAWLLDRNPALLTLPAEFKPLAAALAPTGDPRGEDGGLGMVIGLTLGVGVAIAIQIWRMKRALKAMVGDVEAIIPRNRREMLAALPLCLNAGFSEEMFFRLALPLLIASVTGSVIVGLVASAVLFGLIHAYQGWKGVILTTIFGLFMTFVYLRSGSLIRPMAVHALIDLIALIVRPALAARFGGERRKSRGQSVLPGVETERGC